MKKLSFKLLMGAMLCAASASAGSLTEWTPTAGQHVTFRHGGSAHGYDYFMTATANGNNVTYSKFPTTKGNIFTLEESDTDGQFYLKNEETDKYIAMNVGEGAALNLTTDKITKFSFDTTSLTATTNGQQYGIKAENPQQNAKGIPYIHAAAPVNCVRWNAGDNSSWYVDIIDNIDTKTVTFSYQTADGTSLGSSTAEMLESDTPGTAAGTISGSGNAYTVTLPEGCKEFKLYSGKNETNLWAGTATAINSMTSTYANAHTFIEVPLTDGNFAIFAKGLNKFLPTLSNQVNVATINATNDPAKAGAFKIVRTQNDGKIYGAEYITDGNGQYLNKQSGIGTWWNNDQGSAWFMAYDEETFTTNISNYTKNNIAQSAYCVKLAAGKAALAIVASFTDYEQVTALANAVNALETARFGVAGTNIADLIKDVDDAITAVNDMKKLNLASKIAQLEAYPHGVGLGNYDIAAEITAAKNVANNEDATDEEIETQITAVQNVLNNIGEKLTMPVPGKFYRLKHATQSKYATSQTSGTQLAMANSDQSSNTVWYLDQEGHLVSFANGLVLGKFLSETTKTTWQCYLVSNTDKAGTVTFEAAPAVGKYLIHPSTGRNINNGGNTINSGNSSTFCTGDDWDIVEVTYLPIPATAANKYTAVYSPLPLGLGYGTTKRVTSHEGIISGQRFGKKELESIPANTPVLLELTENHDITSGHVFLPILAESTAGELDGENTNHLSGGIYATAKADGTNYYVAGAEADKFTAHTGDYIPGFTAHLAVATANAPEQGHFTISTYDDVTSIVDIEAATPATDAVYDLQGRRVNADARGIVIVNGKKAIRK